MLRFSKTSALTRRISIDRAMNIEFQKAVFADCKQIHKIQVKSFTQLLEKYQDYDTNPACEPLEIIENKFNQSFTDYYFILINGVKIGAVRVVRLSEKACRISPIFILPEFQGKGYAQVAMLGIEKLYPNAEKWELDTIKQESKLVCFYEKMGYIATGKEEDIKEGMTIVFYEKNLR